MCTIRWLILGLCVVLSGCNGGSPPDNTPPTIANLTISRTGADLIVSATVEDAGTGIASVVAITAVGGSWQVIPMVPIASNRYQATIPPNTTSVRVRAQDKVGNLKETNNIVAPPPQPPF